jgi:ketosteroid isomerase-like protein
MPQRAGPNGKVVGMRLREGPSVTSRGVANLQVVRTLFDAIGGGDLDAIRQVLAADVIFTIPGSFRLAGVFQGPDEFLRGLGQLVQASAGTLRVELVSTAVNGLDGDLVIANYHAAGTVTGETINEHNACLIKLDDGLVREMTDFYGDPVTVARQWN